MKNIYTLVAALATSLTLQAQMPAPSTHQARSSAENTEMAARKMLKKMHRHLSMTNDTRAAEKLTQNAKWLTNLPVDSAIFRQEFIPYAAGSTAWFSTVYSEDLTRYFVGNRIKTVRTLIPEFAKDIVVWIKEVSADSEKLLWESRLPDSVKTNEIIDVPCDLLIDKACKMQVGFNYVVTKEDPVYPAIVPCNRQEAWIQGQSETNGGMPLDYTTMRNFIYGDPNPYYGYYFHCITEGDAGLPDYQLELNGISHDRVPLGTETQTQVYYRSYGAQPINNLTFKSETPYETKDIKISQPVPYLGYGQFGITAKGAEKPSRIPLDIKISEIDGKPFTKEIGASGSIISIDANESYRRKVVMEEFTGTWCGWCPRGMRAIELLSEEYGDQFIPVAVHVNDRMQDDSFFPVIGYNNGNFPGCILNRITTCEPYYGTSRDNSPFFIINDVEDIMNRLTEATLKIDQVDFDTEKGKVSITTSSTFNIDNDMDAYAMSYLITEDSIMDIQKNYFFINRDNPEQLDEALRDLAKQPENWVTNFNHVGRKSYETLGLAGSIGKNIRRFDSHQFTYELELPATIKNKHLLHIVALLLDTKTGEIVNACQQHLDIKDVTGIVRPAAQPVVQIEVSGGVLTVQANGGQVSVFDLSGKRIVTGQVKGTGRYPLGKGVYTVRVDQGNQTLVKKVML